MNLIVQTSMENITGEAILSLLEQAGLATHLAQEHERAFRKSYRVVFVFDDRKLIGCGRLLSDETYQGAIYDVALNKQYRGLGLGREIVEVLTNGLEQMNIILYTTPDKEEFYEHFDFHKLTTGMISSPVIDKMKQKKLVE